MKSSTHSRWTLRALAALAAALALPAAGRAAQNRKLPSRSTSVALYRNDRRLLVANREANSLSVLVVRRRRADVADKLAEVTVGHEPRCVALGPKEREAYVVNAASGTVSVVSLVGERAYEVIAEFPVGTEPRGCATTPSGRRLFVANYTEGTVSVVDTRSRTVLRKVPVGGNPFAVAVTSDGRTDDDQTVFVSQFFAERIPGGPGEAFDDGKRAVVQAFPSTGTGDVTRVTLSPLANVGFTADRHSFCTAIDPGAANDTYCPNRTITDPTDPKIAQDPQGAYPNQLYGLLVRGGQVIVPSVGAGPEPPVKFNVNVQGLVHVIDRASLAEVENLTVNLNAQIKTETQPNPAAGRLDRLFSNEMVALDATADGKTVLFVSRGGNYVLKAQRAADGSLTIGAPAGVVRLQTGNLPDGIAISRNGARAYVNNEVGLSVSVLDLVGNRVLTRDVASSTPPEPGTFEHARLVGKLVFFTALGTPDDGLSATAIRDIVPLDFRNKASDNGWSSCGSCHPDGLADGVTWIFATGPRQTIPLDGFFAKTNPGDQRIANWSAVQGSITDFNNNTRNVQGGKGFAGDPPNPDVFSHGITAHASEALDMETVWVQTIRPLDRPQPADLTRGRDVFAAACANCHGGAKWSKSEVIYRNDPTFPRAPVAGTVALDPGLTNVAAQIVSFTFGADTLRFLDPVGTFDRASSIEIRTDGTGALGVLGFNAPSLLGVGHTAPYFHDGSAATLDDVFAAHHLGGGTIATVIPPNDRAALLDFLLAIDGRTEPMPSETDAFLDALTP